MTELRMLVDNLRSRALLVATAAVLSTGAVAWVFPRETAALVGNWALPVVSFCALSIAFVLAAQWRLLLVLMAALAIPLVLGWNRSSTTSTSHFVGVCLGLLLMVGIGRWATTPRLLRLALMAFLAVGAAVILVGLAGASVRTTGWLASLLLPVQPPPIQLGLAGLGGRDPGDVNANALAAAVLLVLPLGASLLLVRTEEGARSPAFWMASAVVVIGGFTLVICNSRTAWVAIWLILVGLLVKGIRPWFARCMAGTLVVAPLFLVLTFMLNSTEADFVWRAHQAWSSARARMLITTQAFEHWKQSPWLGIGLNQFRVVNTEQGTGPAHAHNMVLQTALDVGIIGSAAYWGLLAFLFVRAVQASSGPSRLARGAAIGSALCLVAVSLFGLSDAVSLGAKVGSLQWMAGGLILAAWHMQRVASPTLVGSAGN